MINYIVQVVLFQALFLAVYDFFLQKETFFKWNRFYLLSTPILSFIIPLFKLESFQKTIPQEYIEQLPTVFLNPQEVIVQANQYSSTHNYLAIAFYIGLVLFLGLFLIKLFKIFQLISTNKVLKKENYSLVLLDDRQSAFSFFKYIFINKHLLKSEDLQIIKHELVHCKQRHTLDLLFFEILKIMLWFNPMVYVYQKRITLLHEYISDAEVVLATNKKTYFNRLLAETFNVENISFVNQFFKHSLIKKRIVMITKEKSKKMKQLKYLLIVPLLVSMLVYVSCSNDSQIDIEQVEKILNEENSISEGKYFEGENGFKMFVGTHLAGEVVSIEEYTEKEKMVFNKFKNIENSKLEISIIINENGDRVFFAKTKYLSNENNKIINDNDGSIPFAIIDEVPVFPGCTGTKLQLRTCLQEKITEHVNKNFNADLASELKLIPGVKRIFVMFKIDKEGNVSDVKARAPHNVLQEEAIRVVKMLPKMLPGKQDGKAVNVKYSLPIAFKVEGDSLDKSLAAEEIVIGTNKKVKIVNDNGVPFAVIDEAPIFPGCVGTKNELRTCLQEKITQSISENFNVNLATELKLQSGVKRIFVVFKINKAGNITDVRVRAPHKKLQEEAIRVINLLPKMLPGKQAGKAVNVNYSLPIAFKVE